MASVSALAWMLTACPGPKAPVGPAPEYEDPPRPSWLDAGAPTPAPPVLKPVAPDDAGAPQV